MGDMLKLVESWSDRVLASTRVLSQSSEKIIGPQTVSAHPVKYITHLSEFRSTLSARKNTIAANAPSSTAPTRHAVLLGITETDEALPSLMEKMCEVEVPLVRGSL
jgi:hypothetical protein